VNIPLQVDQFSGTFPHDLSRAGRIPLVADAIRRLKDGVGREIVIGACLAGPFTLAWQLFGADAWLSTLGTPARAGEIMEVASDFLARVGDFYYNAGADFLTVHEMGGSPQVIGPEDFRSLVKPSLTHLLVQLPSPRVLSICGDTNAIVHDMAECGADGLNVDQRNDLARTRRELPQSVLLGNLDPVGLLSQGSPETVRLAVKNAAAAGANAIWPGCDLYPEISDANMAALLETAKHPLDIQ
jgi:[methyl-Co(III) methanol-specific corrinoid protein]:coenzyme M methyltransferase